MDNLSNVPEYLCHPINSSSSQHPQAHWVVKANIHRTMLGARKTKMNSSCPRGAHGWRTNHPANYSAKQDKGNNKNVGGAALWEILGQTYFSDHLLLRVHEFLASSASRHPPTMPMMSLIDSHQLYRRSTSISHRTQNVRSGIYQKQLADSSKTPLPCPSTTSSGPSAAAEADANLSSSTAHS